MSAHTHTKWMHMDISILARMRGYLSVYVVIILYYIVLYWDAWIFCRLKLNYILLNPTIHILSTLQFKG